MGSGIEAELDRYGEKNPELAPALDCLATREDYRD